MFTTICCLLQTCCVIIHGAQQLSCPLWTAYISEKDFIYHPADLQKLCKRIANGCFYMSKLINKIVGLWSQPSYLL